MLGLCWTSGEVRDVVGIDPPFAVSSAVCADLEAKGRNLSVTHEVSIEVSVTSAVAAHALAEVMAGVLEAHAMIEPPGIDQAPLTLADGEPLLDAVVTNVVEEEEESEEKKASEDKESKHSSIPFKNRG